MVDGLADVHIEPADPASHQVVDCRSDPPADCTTDAIYDGKSNDCPRAKYEPEWSSACVRAFHQGKTRYDRTNNQPKNRVRNQTNHECGPWSNAFDSCHRVPPSELGAHASRSDNVTKGYSQWGHPEYVINHRTRNSSFWRMRVGSIGCDSARTYAGGSDRVFGGCL